MRNTFRLIALVASAADNAVSKESEFRSSLSETGRQRRQRRVARLALQSPQYSAFMTLFFSGHDSSLITVCGIDHCTFRTLLDKFTPLYNRYTPYSDDGSILLMEVRSLCGRPRSMTALQCLGLILMWTRSRGKMSFLCMIFGITDAVCSVFIRFARRILIQILRHDANAQVRMPEDIEVPQLQRAFSRRHTTLRDVYCVADGVKLLLQNAVGVVM